MSEKSITERYAELVAEAKAREAAAQEQGESASLPESTPEDGSDEAGREEVEVESEQSRAVRVIVGEEGEQDVLDWTERHIASSQEAVKNGRHDTIYYPGSGADLVRPLIAYDASHIIAVDLYRYTDLIDRYKELNLQELPSDRDDRQEFVFSYGGVQRRITHIIGDARMVNPEEILGRKPDILHFYYPTGGSMLEEAGPTAYLSAIQSSMSEENYRAVPDDGFFIFDEAPVIVFEGWDETSESVATLFGLRELRPVKRHPYTIMTSSHPSRDEIAQQDKRGFIYQKLHTVTPEQFKAAQEAKMLVYNTAYFNIGYLKAGMIEKVFPDSRDHRETLKRYLVEVSDAMDAVARKCVDVGIASEHAEGFQKSFQKNLYDQLEKSLASYPEFAGVRIQEIMEEM